MSEAIKPELESKKIKTPEAAFRPVSEIIDEQLQNIVEEHFQNRESADKQQSPRNLLLELEYVRTVSAVSDMAEKYIKTSLSLDRKNTDKPRGELYLEYIKKEFAILNNPALEKTLKKAVTAMARTEEVLQNYINKKGADGIIKDVLHDPNAQLAGTARVEVRGGVLTILVDTREDLNKLYNKHSGTVTEGSQENAPKISGFQCFTDIVSKDKEIPLVVILAEENRIAGQRATFRHEIEHAVNKEIYHPFYPERNIESRCIRMMENSFKNELLSILSERSQTIQMIKFPKPNAPEIFKEIMVSNLASTTKELLKSQAYNFPEKNKTMILDDIRKNAPNKNPEQSYEKILRQYELSTQQSVKFLEEAARTFPVTLLPILFRVLRQEELHRWPRTWKQLGKIGDRIAETRNAFEKHHRPQIAAVYRKYFQADLRASGHRLEILKRHAERNSNEQIKERVAEAEKMLYQITHPGTWDFTRVGLYNTAKNAHRELPVEIGLVEHGLEKISSKEDIEPLENVLPNLSAEVKGLLFARWANDKVYLFQNALNKMPEAINDFNQRLDEIRDSLAKNPTTP